MSHKILRISAVMNRTGLARSTIYHYMSKSDFPKQVKLGPRAAGWLEAEVEEWLARRIAITRSR